MSWAMEYGCFTSRAGTSPRLEKATRVRVRHVLVHVPHPRGTGASSVEELRSVLAEVSRPVEMRPRSHAGSRVGAFGLANRSGGKRRGVKAGRHAGEKRVNVRKLR